ncbi:hypothetical protein KUCAC02_017604, partial [Chaenocephalus aceratus]
AVLSTGKVWRDRVDQPLTNSKIKGCWALDKNNQTFRKLGDKYEGQGKIPPFYWDQGAVLLSNVHVLSA